MRGVHGLRLALRPAMYRRVSASLVLVLGLCGACSSTSVAPMVTPISSPDVDAGAEASTMIADKCGTVPPSKCMPANGASIIRGIAHFDPAKLASGGPDAGGVSPQLSIFLAHREYAQKPEWAQGGHPHAYKIMQNLDLTKGEIPFAIDMCELGTAMWSEDNCDFNLILVLDKNGNNVADAFSINQVPDQGELSKMTVVQLSCRGTSACMDINLDCVDGQPCVNYDSPGTCACAAETCNSDSVTCK
jgi:hypothetical protein